MHGLLTRYAKLRFVHAPGMPGTFFPPARVSDTDMHHGTCVTHVPWCMPGSLTSGSLWSRWRGKRSRHSRRMRNPQFYVSGKSSIELPHISSLFTVMNHAFTCFGHDEPHVMLCSLPVCACFHQSSTIQSTRVASVWHTQQHSSPTARTHHCLSHVDCFSGPWLKTVTLDLCPLTENGNVRFSFTKNALYQIREFPRFLACF